MIAMKLSFCTDSLSHLPFEQMLDKLLELSVYGLEMATAAGHRHRICVAKNCSAASTVVASAGASRHVDCGAEANP